MTKKLTAEHRAAISRGMKGQRKTPEHRANLSKSITGRKMSDEARLANSRAQTGKKLSEETKRKIGDAHRGENSPHWKGGVAKVGRWDDPRYFEWQRAVFTRDNWACQRCGYRNTHGDRLNAHHLAAWADFPESRFEITNGLTLCVDCHFAEQGKKRRMEAEPLPCACGCGHLIRAERVAHGSRYLPGHHARGRKRPLSERLAIGAKLKGRAKTADTLARMSIAQRKRFATKRESLPAEFTESERQRFWSQIDQSADCWLWTDSTDLEHPAGSISFRNQHWRAPRLAYVLTYGPIPPHVHVRHCCPHGPNLRCVRPDHLYVVRPNVPSTTVESSVDAG